MASKSKASRIARWVILGVGLALLVVKAFFVGYYRIPQNGMYPGYPAGSIVFAAKRAYSRPADVKHGDIIVFEREENGQRYKFIWRVVGLPGEKVEAAGESLAIDGKAVQRQRVREADGAIIFRERFGDRAYEIALSQNPASLPPAASVTVPSDQFFVMGDNRFDARDSRYFGPIPFSSIIGKKL